MNNEKLILIWNKIKQIIQFDETIDPVIFNNYLKNAYIHSIVDNDCLIIVNSTFAKELLTKNLTSKMEIILNKITNSKLQIKFLEISELNAKPVIVKTESKNEKKKGKNTYCFNNFIKGDNNNAAYEGSITITKHLGKKWNPLFIYGSSGLGKTHLLYAIKNEIINSEGNNKKIIFITAEEFGRMVTEILRKNASEIENFKNSFNQYDILLVDDIQFLAYRSKTSEIFSHIFNNFINQQKQIVITSDSSPDELFGFEERTISRFQSGLSIGIDIPDYDTTLKILKAKMENLNYDIKLFSSETIKFLVTSFSSDIRKLEGALNRLIFHSNLSFKSNNLITIDDTIKAFKTNSGELLKEKLTIKKIKKVVADYFNIPIKLLNSKTRIKNITNARHIAMYLTKELLNESYVSIGKEFGGKDHTTIINACKKIKNNINKNYNFKKNIDYLTKACLKGEKK